MIKTDAKAASTWYVLMAAKQLPVPVDTGLGFFVRTSNVNQQLGAD